MSSKRVQFIDNQNSDRFYSHRRMKTDPEFSFKDVGKSILREKRSYDKSSQYRKQFSSNYDENIFKIINPELNVDEKTLSQPKYIKVATKFEGQSRYKQDYKDGPYMQKIRKRNRQKLHEQRQKTQMSNRYKQRQPFQNTTYNSLYQPFQVKLTQPTQQSKLMTPQPVKFKGISSYIDDYRKFTIKNEINHRCPVEELNLPSRNYSNSKHIYYNPKTNNFS